MKRLCDVRFEMFYLATALILGLSFAIITPPNATPDEISHQVKIVRVASGNFFGINKELLLPDIKSWYMSLNDNRMLSAPYNISKAEITDIISQKLICEPQTTAVNNTVTSYSPLPYLLSALNYNINCSLGSSFGWFLYSSRIIGLLISITLVFIAIKVAPDLRFTFFTVAMLPTVLYQFSAIAADSLVISLTMLYIAYISRYMTNEKKHDLLIIFAAGLALSFSKPAYVWLVALSLPIIILKSKYSFSLTLFVKIIIFAIIPIILQVILLSLSKGSTPHVVNVESNIEYLKSHPFSLISEIYHTPFVYPFGTQWNIYESLIGKLGWLSIPIPNWSYMLAAVNFALLPFINRLQAPSLFRIYFIAISLFSAILMCIPLYLYATNQPDQAIFGLQGRYFIPSLTIFLISISGVFKINFFSKIAPLYIFSVLLISVTSLITLYHSYY